MIIGLCIGGVVLVGIIALVIVISVKKGKKNKNKLDDVLSKLKQEKEEIATQEKIEEEKKKEEDAFSNITLSDDIEESNDDFDNFFNNPSFPDPDIDEFAFKKEPKVESFNEMDDLFGEFDKPRRKKVKKKLSRDEDFEKFMDEHSFSRRVFDKTLLTEIRGMSPKLKAIMLSKAFDKFDD